MSCEAVTIVQRYRIGTSHTKLLSDVDPSARLTGITVLRKKKFCVWKSESDPSIYNHIKNARQHAERCLDHHCGEEHQSARMVACAWCGFILSCGRLTNGKLTARPSSGGMRLRTFSLWTYCQIKDHTARHSMPFVRSSKALHGGMRIQRYQPLDANRLTILDLRGHDYSKFFIRFSAMVSLGIVFQGAFLVAYH